MNEYHGYLCAEIEPQVLVRCYRSPLPPCCSYLSVMMLPCAVLMMLLSFLREGICSTDISVSLIFIAGKERAILEPVELCLALDSASRITWHDWHSLHVL